MYYLKFEEKLVVKKIADEYCLLRKDEEKFELLKGSLSDSKIKIVEKLLEEVKYFYQNERSSKEKEAKCFCIGKTIVILEMDKKTVLEIISLRDFDLGLNQYKSISGESYREHMKQEIEVGLRLEKLVNEFLSLGKWDKIKKGEILKELDTILTDNKKLGKKTEMWKKLGLSNSDKSMLTKRYNLFKEFEKIEFSLDVEEYRRIVEEMIDGKLKKITNENNPIEEKEKMIMEEIEERKGRNK